MKTILLHGLGQTAQDWKEVVCQLSSSNVDCPELFSSMENEISYPQILGDLERRYSNVKEPFRICGLSLGALLAIDFAIRHGDKVASLVLIGTQYKVPSLLIDFQNLIFRCMPNKTFDSMGLSKSNTIKLSLSMRSLDFTAQLSNILCPVTILCGKKDTANLKASKRLKELLPQAALHIIPNAGHELNKYAPNMIAEILNN
ncbi:alpha/beta fold hydrolase [Enterocloster clostridioformis]|uniref:alpha/beta fold hydrolase n=1 Tax=Enterocloster clostridioformis TaxID=1531 RepID=UPI0022E1F700|nr:alpha/beta hydrolase [Enterocloster clostridioformis]